MRENNSAGDSIDKIAARLEELSDAAGAETLLLSQTKRGGILFVRDPVVWSAVVAFVHSMRDTSGGDSVRYDL